MGLRERDRGRGEGYRGNEMDIDDDDFRDQGPSAAYGDFDRRPQAIPSRHQVTEASVPTSSYTYTNATTTQAPGFFDRVPRTATTTTPDPVVVRPAQAIFGQSVYPANTQAPWQQPPATTTTAYDPRTGQPLQAPYLPPPGGQYQESRHKQR